MHGRELKIYYPQNPSLEKYIEYYYFLKTDSSDFLSTYYSFPNVVYSLNIHRHASCQINGHQVSVVNDAANDHLCILQGKYNKPILVRLEGILDKVTIGFKPLGLNHFIGQVFSAIAPHPSQLFVEWEAEPLFGAFLQSFFECSDHQLRIAALETFLLTQYRPLRDEEILAGALRLLTPGGESPAIAAIAATLGLNERAFHRLFYKHLAISPVAYRQIARFRHALKNKLFSDQFETLTQIGYESNFYDQSYFIKMYRKATGDNPTRFFKAIEKLADDRLIFKFINR